MDRSLASGRGTDQRKKSQNTKEGMQAPREMGILLGKKAIEVNLVSCRAEVKLLRLKHMVKYVLLAGLN